MRYRVALVVAAVIAGSTGCGSSALSPSEAWELGQARARWKTHGPAHYTVEMRRGCFCPPEISDWGRIEVDGDTLVSVMLLDGTVVPTSYWYARPPVPRLFEEIASTRGSWLDHITARYDPDNGIPTKVRFTSRGNVQDAGYVIETRGLVSLDP